MGGSDLTLVLDGSQDEESDRMFVVMYLEGEANSVMLDCWCLIAFNVPVDVTRPDLNICLSLLVIEIYQDNISLVTMVDDSNFDISPWYYRNSRCMSHNLKKIKDLLL